MNCIYKLKKQKEKMHNLIELFSKDNKDLLNQSMTTSLATSPPPPPSHNSSADHTGNKQYGSGGPDSTKKNNHKVAAADTKIPFDIHDKAANRTNPMNINNTTDAAADDSRFCAAIERSIKMDEGSLSVPMEVDFKLELAAIYERDNTLNRSSSMTDSRKKSSLSDWWFDRMTTSETKSVILNKVFKYLGDGEKSDDATSVIV